MSNEIKMEICGKEMIRIEENGDFFVKEKLTTNDMEIYQAFKDFLADAKIKVALTTEELFDAYKKPYIERVLELDQGSLSDEKFMALPETKALLKVVSNYPWILESADNRFVK